MAEEFRKRSAYALAGATMLTTGPVENRPARGSRLFKRMGSVAISATSKRTGYGARVVYS